MTEQLKESLEEHKVNLEVLDHLTPDSIKNLYAHLIKEVDQYLKDK